LNLEKQFHWGLVGDRTSQLARKIGVLLSLGPRTLPGLNWMGFLMTLEDSETLCANKDHAELLAQDDLSPQVSTLLLKLDLSSTKKST